MTPPGAVTEGFGLGTRRGGRRYGFYEQSGSRWMSTRTRVWAYWVDLKRRRYESALRDQRPMLYNGSQHRLGRRSSVFGSWQGSAPSCTEWNPHALMRMGSGHPEGTPVAPQRGSSNPGVTSGI